MKLKITTSFTLLFFLVSLYCLAQVELWSNIVPKSDLRSITRLSDGYFVAVGITSGAVNGGGQQDWQIVKIDPEGSVIWQKSIGSKKNDFALFTTMEGNNGEFLVLGEWNGFVNGDIRTGESKLIKFDRNGEILWERLFSNNSYCSLDRIIKTDDNGYFLAGLYNSSTDNSWKNKNYDNWLIRLDEYGDIIWKRVFGCPGTDKIKDVLMLENKELLVLGYSFMNDKKTEDEENCEIMLYHLSQKGTIIGSKAIGGSGFDDVERIYKVTNDGYLLVGNSDSPDFGKPISRLNKDDEEDELEADIFICKLDDNFNLEWVKRFGGTDSDEVQSCVETDNGILIIGWTHSDDGNFELTKGESPTVLLELNRNGKIKWLGSLGQKNGYLGFSVEKIDNKKFLAVGSSNGDAWITAFQKEPSKKKHKRPAKAR